MTMTARLVVAIMGAPIVAFIFAAVALYQFVALMVDFVLTGKPMETDKGK